MSVFIGFPLCWVQLGESEQRASTLQLSVERLSTVLVAEAESSSKDRAQGSPLTDGSSAPQRLQQLQSALTAGELDRRMLQVGTGTPGCAGSPWAPCHRVCPRGRRCWMRPGGRFRRHGRRRARCGSSCGCCGESGRRWSCARRSWRRRSGGCRRWEPPDRWPYPRGALCALLPTPYSNMGAAGCPILPPLQMLLQQEEKEAAALRGLRAEKRGLQERVGSLQSSLSQLEAERREAERSSLRLEKDNSALKKTLEKVSARRPSWHPWVLSGWPPRPYTSGDTNTAPQWLGTHDWFAQKQVGHGYKKCLSGAKSFPERKMRFVQRGHGCAGGVCACTRAFCAPERGV